MVVALFEKWLYDPVQRCRRIALIAVQALLVVCSEAAIDFTKVVPFRGCRFLLLIIHFRWRYAEL